jgi:hypothetical protein
MFHHIKLLVEDNSLFFLFYHIKTRVEFMAHTVFCHTKCHSKII